MNIVVYKLVQVQVNILCTMTVLKALAEALEAMRETH